MSKKIAFASHVATIGGKQYDAIGDALKDSLSEVAGTFIFVRHSMDGLIPSEVQYYHGDKVVDKRKLKVVRSFAPLRYITEVMASVRYFWFSQKVDIYIGIDPLNALAGILLRRVHRVKTVIFYTSDYSQSRFNDKLMDWVYHAIDKYCVKHADEVWSVSSRIVSIRKQMGLVDERNIFVPNAPPAEYAKLFSTKKDKYELVTLGIIDKQLDFRGVITAVAELKDTYPKIKFTIIGNGPEEGDLEKLAEKYAVADRIEFTGRLSFKEAQARVAHAGIGLALYTGAWGFNYYGDSTKCREFFTYGLPVISTDTHSTIDELVKQGAGIKVEQSTEDYVRAIKDILKDYNNYAKNSYELGQKYLGVHEIQLQRLLTI